MEKMEFDDLEMDENWILITFWATSRTEKFEESVKITLIEIIFKKSIWLSKHRISSSSTKPIKNGDCSSVQTTNFTTQIQSPAWIICEKM